MEIIFAVIILGVLGLVFGIGLAVASKKFNVQVDPKLEQVQHLLPGGNCGACGNPGCFGFAESLLKGGNTVDDCRVCSEEIKEKIAGIMGVALGKQVRKVATLHCAGGVKVKDKYVYSGVEDCVAANMVLGGQKSCVFACLGFGTCARACPFGAITISAEGLPVINKDKCRACNKCVLACPKKLISLVSVTHPVFVACSSHDMGKDVRAVCSVGCIACRMCEKACKFDAIHVIDNLAVIDYHKCTSCGECVKVCPTKTIRIRE
ncbi:MAG: RnfABCDGE type electron transport complex subunit B [Candidatus Omnitrophica bacterium]|jgi:RnfABCDGE-type electron transport complex B subunit|nr:RnfABCDGE type electron transport complex subunit B [Candidatus Omnitrophota bacterium]MDD3274756.1 RnfABCDGE type electron transport complex subunit B [Candidatus Omnitrophota bacterium]MDD5078265.1 RnfABCDGE type electron transport complex subunit B [Candidatus Omnitrophota bacterium]